MEARIYLVTNEINNKQYVGQTRTAKSKVGHGKLIKAAYKKHGFYNFKYEIICSYINNQNILNYLEKFWIETFNTIAPNGYNIEIGGFEGKSLREFTKETREKMSSSRLGNKNPFFGKTHTTEVRNKISESVKARVVSDETKEKLKKIHTGRKRSAETKRKISEAKKSFYANKKLQESQ